MDITITLGSFTFGLIAAIAHIILAFGIWIDSSMLWRVQRRKTFAVGGIFWFLATLAGGVLTVLAYWIIHHSTLGPQYAPREPDAKQQIDRIGSTIASSSPRD